MKAKLVSEQLEFDFRKPPPHKRFQSIKTGPGEKIPNPRKERPGGLLPDEEEQIRKYEALIWEIESKIEDLEEEKRYLKQDIQDLTEPRYSDLDLDNFYGQVQQEFGDKALDILNSGMSDDEKVKELDRISVKDDQGYEDFKGLVDEYNEYHPDDPPEEKIEEMEKEMEKIDERIEILQKKMDKFQMKIFNIETY